MKIYIPFFLILIFQQGFSQASLNKVDLDSTINTQDFSFVVTGHIYGDGTNKSGYPASTFLGNFDWIQNDLEPAFIWFTGDVFSDVKNDLPFYQRSLFSKVKSPMYNAVGNHDLSGEFYQENIANTYFSFYLGSTMFITLDAETDDSQIIGEQLDFFKEQLEKAKFQEIKNVFICTHRPIWAETNPKFQGLFADNTRSTFGDNFLDDVHPLLTSFQDSYAIYWFSGSMGNVPVSFFYHKEKDNNITYIQTAIRNMKRDAILEVDIKNDEISFKPYSLTDQKLETLEYYNMDFWKAYQRPVMKFNYRLVPLYIKQMITHRYFWYGMVGMLLVFFFSGLAFRRFRVRKK
jgi:hypothetical protein